MTVVLAMVLAGLGTFALRSSMVVLQQRVGSIDWLERRLALVGPAVLGAFVASWLAVEDGRRVAPDGLEVLAVAAALVTVRRTGRVGLALGVGLPVYWAGVLAGFS